MNKELELILPELERRARTFRENLKPGFVPHEFLFLLQTLAAVDAVRAAEAK